MTADEWVEAQLDDAPPLSAHQISRVSLLLAGAAVNIEAAAQVAVTENGSKS